MRSLSSLGAHVSDWLTGQSVFWRRAPVSGSRAADPSRRVRQVSGRRPQLSYANVVSSLALFVALGGTSYAVARNSVGSQQLRPNAVSSSKVKDRSLQTKDLSATARLGRRGPRGPAGPQGQFVGTPEDWKPLAMQNGWAFFGGDHQRPGYRKDRQGLVHLRGLLTQTAGAPAAEDTMAALPAGYKPSVRTIFAVATGQPIAFARLVVDPDGTLKRTGAGTVLEPDYTSLNGVVFWPE